MKKSSSWFSLRFESRDLENAFWEKVFEKNAARIRVGALVGLLIFALFAILDTVIIKQNLETIRWMRGIFIFFALGFVALTFTRFFLRHYHMSITILVISAGLVIVAMIGIMDMKAANLYYVGILIVVLYANLFGLKIQYYMMINFVLLLAYEYVAIFIVRIDIEMLISNNFFMISAMTIAIFANYFFEHFNRRIFLQSMKIEESKQEAIRANQAKSEFLANMSHEIRTPLNSVIGFSQIMIKLNKSGNTKDFGEYLNYIKVSGESLLDIVNGILDISKIEANKLTINEERTDVKDFLQDIYNLHLPIADKKNIRMELDKDENMPDYIIADRAKLKQIMMNLVSNAIKFSKSGGTVIIQSSCVEDMCHFSVIDDGIGIAKENLDLIFKAFEQEDTSLSRNYEGTGLGLTICKKMVELMDGSISVESEKGKGSTFHIKFPCKIA